MSVPEKMHENTILLNCEGERQKMFHVEQTERKWQKCSTWNI